MRAYSWILVSGFVAACSGGAFTSSPEGGSSGSGGSESSGDAGGDGATSGVLGRAGRGVGGSLIGSGGKISVGGTSNLSGSATGGSAMAGSATGGMVGMGGMIGSGGDLIGVAGDVVAGGTPPTGGVGGMVGTAGNTGSAGSGTDTSCPALLPVAGDKCTTGLLCSFTKDIRPNCRPQSSCDNGAWALKDAGCKQIHSCSGDVAVGGVCDPALAAACILSGSQFCACSMCAGNICGNQATWHCTTKGTNPDCPQIAPNIGEACTVPQLKCQYGGCSLPQSGPITATCDGKTWSWGGVICPL